MSGCEGWCVCHLIKRGQMSEFAAFEDGSVPLRRIARSMLCLFRNVPRMVSVSGLKMTLAILIGRDVVLLSRVLDGSPAREL